MDPGFPPMRTALPLEVGKLGLQQVGTQPFIKSTQNFPISKCYQQHPASSNSPCSSSGSLSPQTNGTQAASTQGHLLELEIGSYNGFDSLSFYEPLPHVNDGHFYYHPWELSHEVIGLPYQLSDNCMSYNSGDLPKPQATNNVRQVAYQGRRPNSYGQLGSLSPSPTDLGNGQIALSSGSSHNHSFQRGYHLINQVFKPLVKNEDEAAHNRKSSQSSNRNNQNTEIPPFFSHKKFETIKQLNENSQKSRAGETRALLVKKRRENEKRFPCPECGRMFARAFNMETHRNTHSGYRPHQCSNCLKFFSRRHDLHRHMVAVHQDHSKVPLSNRSSLNKSTEITKRE